MQNSHFGLLVTEGRRIALANALAAGVTTVQLNSGVSESAVVWLASEGEEPVSPPIRSSRWSLKESVCECQSCRLAGARLISLKTSVSGSEKISTLESFVMSASLTDALQSPEKEKKVALTNTGAAVLVGVIETLGAEAGAGEVRLKVIAGALLGEQTEGNPRLAALIVAGNVVHFSGDKQKQKDDNRGGDQQKWHRSKQRPERAEHRLKAAIKVKYGHVAPIGDELNHRGEEDHIRRQDYHRSSGPDRADNSIGDVLRSEEGHQGRGDAPEHARRDEPRLDQRHVNAVVQSGQRQLHLHRLVQAIGGPLRGAVVGHANAAEVAGQRGDGHQEGLDGGEVGHRVHRHRPLDRLIVAIQQQVTGQHAGIVHQNVHRAEVGVALKGFCRRVDRPPVS
ncbi:hypothetical protein TYRP_005153 [Tyrophagus putrescentiae]|nr:hypothetical protein TYRP_005153 [Tyrophagus putrescentiae]